MLLTPVNSLVQWLTEHFLCWRNFTEQRERERVKVEVRDLHNKTYHPMLELRKRRVWEDNLHRINKHNAEATIGHHSYTLRANHLADMLDWRKKGFVTSSLNQLDCGSCYAFSIVTAIEGQLFKQSGQYTELSPQQIVDCSTVMGNYGCSGGSLRNTLRYLERSGGLMTASEYPYTAKQSRCRFRVNETVVHITSWAVLPARDEKALQVAIATMGPVAASINASPHTFQLYHTGIYDDPSCSSDSVNHAVVVVGYTKDVWILKNWWSDKWGEDGYMRLARHKNQCGITNYAAYSIL
uniref:Uncharacterized protein n=1 Tax=Timema bartmani TaxID=61472 RepID=A0A7R9I177_9NEOP|nr:unnamed protein product [Timema bartmani]